MNIKVENCVLTSDSTGFVVEVYGEVEKIDNKTKEKTGEKSWEIKAKHYPASLKQGLIIIFSETLRSSDTSTLRELMTAIERAEKHITQAVEKSNV